MEVPNLFINFRDFSHKVLSSNEKCSLFIQDQEYGLILINPACNVCGENTKTQIRGDISIPQKNHDVQINAFQNSFFINSKFGIFSITMSTFNGRLENPLLHFIAIDNFSEKNHDASVFFVSHAHSDHLRNFIDYGATLFSSNSGKTLYCTHITKRLLQIKYNNISDDNVVSLNVGESTILRAPQNSENENEHLITVTLLPTLHVLGSVMFLFQCQGISALYTGDFRIHTGDVAKIKGLHDKDGNPLKITDLYLDTTFADTDRLWFPKRDHAVAKIIELSEEWLDESETNLVALRVVSYYGYESLIIDLSKALNTKILVEDSHFPHFKYIPEMDEFISFSDSISSDTFRGKRPRMGSNRLGRVHVCPDFREKTCNRCFDRYGIQIKNTIRIIKPCAYSFKLEPGDYSSIFIYGRKFCKVAYSTHCSLTELQFFTNYLKPNNIYPSVVADFTSSERILALLLNRPSESTLSDEYSAELSNTEQDTDTDTESDRSSVISLDSPPC